MHNDEIVQPYVDQALNEQGTGWEEFIQKYRITQRAITPGNTTGMRGNPSAHTSAKMCTMELYTPKYILKRFLLATGKKDIQQVTLSEALDQICSYAEDGMQETFESWKEVNDELARAYRDLAEDYYNFCRSVYKKMHSLVGEKGMQEFLDMTRTDEEEE